MNADSQLASQDRVADDLPCPRCGYNLHTWAWAGTCPECNLPVALAATGHEFRLRDMRCLRRLRLALGVWVGALVIVQVEFLLLTLWSLGGSLWVRDATDVTVFYRGFSVVAWPVSLLDLITGILYAVITALLAAAVPRWQKGRRLALWLLRGWVLVLLLVGVNAGWRRLAHDLGMSPATILPEQVWAVLTLLATITPALFWVNLQLCGDRRAAQLRWTFNVGLVLVVCAAAEDLALRASWVYWSWFAPRGGRMPLLLHVLETWLTHHEGIAAGLRVALLLIVWKLVRRLQAAERASAADVQPQKLGGRPPA
ncbi:MAG: hypothetical protein AB1716_21060 [Planctomycetota bacterium]